MELIKYTNLNDKYGYLQLIFQGFSFRVLLDTPEGTWIKEYTYDRSQTPLFFFLREMGKLGCRFVLKDNDTVTFEYVYVDYSTYHAKSKDIQDFFKGVQWS